VDWSKLVLFVTAIELLGKKQFCVWLFFLQTLESRTIKKTIFVAQISIMETTDMPTDDTSNSGYLDDAFEGLGRTFTDITIFRQSEFNVVARAKRYGRWWLLKGLRPELAGQMAYRQWLRKEMELMVGLQHPAIVSTAGMEQVDGLGECIVMEYVEGKTLRQMLDEGSTTRAQRRKMASDLLEAVEYLHAMGIVHRDLKPQNVMVTANGLHVKLVDFGLADSDSHTLLKQPAGTPKYMSPEQKKKAVADVRNDIYSLGVILGQMDLGGTYGPLIKRCLLPANRRYQNLAEMRRDFLRCELRPRMAAACLMALGLLLLLGMMGQLAWQLRKQRDVARQQEHQLMVQDKTMERQQKRVASLEQEAAGAKEQQDEQLRTIATLADSLARITVSNKQMRERQETEGARRKAVEKLKKDAEEMLRRAYQKVGEGRIDKVDPQRKIGIFFSVTIEEEKQRFLNRIRPEVNDSEYMEISVYIGNYCEQLANMNWGELGFCNDNK